MHADLLTNDRVSIKKFKSSEFVRGLQDDEVPMPVSPKLAPYQIDNPVFGAKNYFWCSCGMSKKQPFCDSSHKGTKFNPLKFTLESPSDQMHICGCKHSTNAPFCDGKTCISMLNGEDVTANIDELTEPVEAEQPYLDHFNYDVAEEDLETPLTKKMKFEGEMAKEAVQDMNMFSSILDKISGSGGDQTKK